MKITIFGAGYVGLSTAVCFATKYDVSLVDVDHEKISAIKAGKSLIYEAQLDELLEKGLSSGNLRIFNIEENIPPSEIIFIAVGTPSDQDGYINLQFVRNVVKTIQKRQKEILNPNYSLIAIRSTVIPGTTRRYLQHLEKRGNIGIAFSPEFLSQGTAIKDTLYPCRMIIGSNTAMASTFLKSFYTNFYGEKIPILQMSIESAEFAKYAANAFLATKISFVNELANIVESVDDADIGDVMDSIGYDPRISPFFLKAGIGFGGSCFPKDVRALLQFAQDNLAEKPSLLNAVLEVNENRPLKVTKLLREHLGELDGKIIAIFGLTFKPGTNDIRETPALSVIRSLWRNGAKIHAHDPIIDRIDLRSFSRYGVKFFSDIESCLTGTHACILLTEWPEYQEISINKLVSNMAQKIIIDGRRIYADRKIPVDVCYLTIGSSINRKNHLPFNHTPNKSSNNLKSFDAPLSIDT
ncbi:MAG: UDP-glucose/GDP-mannose dehydrogenase family protein [Candidatus Lokiarchaeota archaeon]|nr:UDP-glucose/GDP-mannose dehydrogenase family protein [Candidatus Lokiarchaeota archaeon]